MFSRITDVISLAHVEHSYVKRDDDDVDEDGGGAQFSTTQDTIKIR